MQRETTESDREEKPSWTFYSIKLSSANHYTDDLIILDDSVSKMNELLEVLRVQGARVSLKINVKKTKSPRLGISGDKKVSLVKEKIDQVDSFTFLGSIISKDCGSSEDVKNKIAKAQGVFFTV